MIWQIILGGIAGYLAGVVMKGKGYGIIIDIVLGLVGGWLGGWIATSLNIHLGGSAGYLIIAFLGAVILVWLSRIVRNG